MANKTAVHNNASIALLQALINAIISSADQGVFEEGWRLGHSGSRSELYLFVGSA